MKIVLLDDTRKMQQELTNALQKKKHEVAACVSSNDFMATLEKNKFDMVLLDLESWDRGKSIYGYFGIAKRLESFPVVFYNAPSDFAVLGDRLRHDKDKIVFAPAAVEDILSHVQDGR